jgi:tetratricopeptide (TPR) repeat protein
MALRPTFAWLALLLLGAPSRANDALVQEIENQVDLQHKMAAWQKTLPGATLAFQDKIRTGELSRATVLFSDRSTLRLDELTTAQIVPPNPGAASSNLEVQQGGAYFFSRERTPEVNIKTPAANGALRGTQLMVRVIGRKTLMTVFEGEVELSNPHGRVRLKSGEQGEAEIGQAPRKTAVLEAVNILQWALYYPAVLEPNELRLGVKEATTVAASLAAYRQGDLLGALEKYPKGYEPGSTAGKLYRAGVMLAVGQVTRAEAALTGVPTETPGRRALAEMIAAVKFATWTRVGAEPTTAAEWLAESYYLQSKGELEPALVSAKKATAAAPGFGYAWAHVAELEFSFGRTSRALKALAEGLKLAPENAQAHALQGFLLSAQNKITGARAEFEEAVRLDGALANGWLGRGLMNIRQGRDEQGRKDLQVATTVEPNRSIFHAYLGKAFSQVGDSDAARRDLKRAKELDPNDPTPLLYSAIQSKQENKYNQAVRELEESLRLNNNRRIYRSSFLLDQDRAIRSTNLAAIYQNDGMPEVAVREATRAVSSDYGSAPAHLFLANAFDALRDPTRILLRYETPWFNELLIANLLSPVGGGPLSQFVSQQEYSKLFEADRLGVSTVTEYFSYGELREVASQYGQRGNLSYALDAEYQYNDGLRPNNKIDRLEAYATFKLQLTPQDTIFLQTKYENQQNGDIFQRYDQRELDRDFSAQTFDFRELQEPGLILAGLHHEWSPGNHTLLLLGRLANDQRLTALNTRQLTIFRDVTREFPKDVVFPGDIFSVEHVADNHDIAHTDIPLLGRGHIIGFDGTNLYNFQYEPNFEILTGELNQILTLGPHTLVFGGRLQKGAFETKDRLTGPLLGPTTDAYFANFYGNPAADQDVTVDFSRTTLYAYDFWRAAPWLSLIGGVAYDRQTYPENFRSPPVSDKEQHLHQVSPKAAFIFQPLPSTTLRGAFTRSVSGASFDESIRLEPTQLAGFTQASRTFVSESIIGSIAGAHYETWGFSLEQKLPTSTYLAVEVNSVKQDFDRTIGVFDFPESFDNFDYFAAFPSSLRQKVIYREDSLSGTVNQLLGERWSVGARYKLAISHLRTVIGSVQDAAAEQARAGASPADLAAFRNLADSRQAALLHQISLFALYNHPSGFFARGEANWFNQENDGFRPDAARPHNDPTPGDDFWQLNTYAGWRFFRNQCELSVGLLNLTDADYRLQPLNYYSELPRHRTFFARVKLSF